MERCYPRENSGAFSGILSLNDGIGTSVLTVCSLAFSIQEFVVAQAFEFVIFVISVLVHRE